MVQIKIKQTYYNMIIILKSDSCNLDWPKYHDQSQLGVLSQIEYELLCSIEKHKHFIRANLFTLEKMNLFSPHYMRKS